MVKLSIRDAREVRAYLDNAIKEASTPSGTSRSREPRGEELSTCWDKERK
jgi:hypothetical protein